jgi:glycerol-3-phosphate acyltransferase PlsY
MQNVFLSLLIGYALGSIPFSQIVAKLVTGDDLRKFGSRNVGANNLISSAGVGWGLLGAFLDIAKGAASLWIAQSLGVPFPQYLLAGLAAVAGHNWSIWLKFRGGKGLATGMGAMAWLIWPFAVVCAIIWVIVHRTARNGTTATIVAFTVGVIGLLVTRQPGPLVVFAIGILTLVFLASFDDLAKTFREADIWTENFVTSKEKAKRPARTRSR